MSTTTSEIFEDSDLLKRAEAEALRRRREILRAMTPEERFRLSAEIYEMGVAHMTAGILHRNPQADVPAELRRRMLPKKLRLEFEDFLRKRNCDPG